MSDDSDELVELATGDAISRAPLALFFFAARAAHGGDDAALLAAHRRALELAQSVMTGERGMPAQLFGLCGALLTDPRACQRVLGDIADSQAVADQFVESVTGMLMLAGQRPELRGDVARTLERMLAFACAVAGRTPDAVIPDSPLGSVFTLLDDARAEVDRLADAPAADPLQGRVREALGEALKRAHTGEEPVSPFAMLWMNDHRLLVVRPRSERYEDRRVIAFGEIKQQKAADVDSFCVVYVDPRAPVPMIILRAGAPGRRDRLFAQMYKFASEGQPFELVGATQLVKEADDSLLPS